MQAATLVLGGSKAVAADGHSWEGMVTVGDGRRGFCVSLCTDICENPFPKSLLHTFLVPPPHSLLPLLPLDLRLLFHLPVPPPHHLIFDSLEARDSHFFPDQMCQQLFNDGSINQAKLGQQLNVFWLVLSSYNLSQHTKLFTRVRLKF